MGLQSTLSHARHAPLAAAHQQHHVPQASPSSAKKVRETSSTASPATGLWAEASRDPFSQFPSETTAREVFCL